MTAHEQADWAVDRATALPEFWANVAKHLGFVEAWRLMLVSRAACAGSKEFLGTLPGLIVCGGMTTSSDVEAASDVWRLDLAMLRWEPMPALITGRSCHACCAVRGALVVLGGQNSVEEFTSSVEMLLRQDNPARAAACGRSEGTETFAETPPLSCSGIVDTAAIAVEGSDGAARQVLLLGGWMDNYGPVSAVHLVDLATGVCTPQPNLLCERDQFAAARLPDGCVVCAGGLSSPVGGVDTALSAAEVFQPPEQGALDPAWTWRALSELSVGRVGCRGCVLSDGRLAVLGGSNSNDEPLNSCETLAVGVGELWQPMSSMHDARLRFACAAVAGGVIVAGGSGLKSAEIFDEVLNRWLRLPCDLPVEMELYSMGSALL